MKLHYLALPLVAALSQVAPCQNQYYPLWSQTSMCVTTSIGTCGSLCEPFQCQPNYTLASAGETLHFEIGGPWGQPFLLFCGIPSPNCQPVAGIYGEIGLWAPIITLNVGTISIARRPPQPECVIGTANLFLPIPSTVPPGTDFRFQVMGINEIGPSATTLAFSRATEVRCR